MREFLSKLFSSSDEVSSKRIFGGLGFITMLIAILFIVFFKIEVSDNHTTLIYTVLIISASMLGLDTIKGIFKPKNNE